MDSDSKSLNQIIDSDMDYSSEPSKSEESIKPLDNDIKENN
jgi:hypothetical protein